MPRPSPFRYFNSRPEIIRLAVMLYIRFNHFNRERHLYNRDNLKLNRAAALDEWRQLGAA